MSEAISALAGASFDGYVKITEAGLRGMITLRGDLSNVTLKNAVTGVTGTDFPAQRGISQNGDRGIAWMSPDELLVMVPYAEVVEVVETLRGQLAKQHCLIENVSDARAVFRLEGTKAREVIAKISPADLSDSGLPKGEIRRSRIAQVAAAYWLVNDTDFELVTFRSTATYTFNLLKNAAQPGSEVGYF